MSGASPVHHPPSAGCHDRAVLLYEYVGKRIVDLQHTEVPDAYRGRGIAKHLAKVGCGDGADRACVVARGQTVPTLPTGYSWEWTTGWQHTLPSPSPSGAGGSRSGPRP